MTLPIQHFDTDAMRQIADYKPPAPWDMPSGHVLVERSIWNTLVADHLAAADHIDELEFERKQRTT